MGRAFLSGHLIRDFSDWVQFRQLPQPISWRVFQIGSTGPYLAEIWTEHRNSEVLLQGSFSYPEIMNFVLDERLKKLQKILSIVNKYGQVDWVAMCALVGQLLRQQIFFFLYADGDEFVVESSSDGLKTCHIRFTNIEILLEDEKFSFSPVIYEEDPLPLPEKVLKQLETKYAMTRKEPIHVYESSWFSGGLIADLWPVDIGKGMVDMLEESMDEPAVLQEDAVMVATYVG